MEDTRYPDHGMVETTCPGCQKVVGAALSTKVMSPPPEPGDISICSYCAVASTFRDDLTLRALTHDEFVDLSTETKIYIDRATRAVVGREGFKP